MSGAEPCDGSYRPLFLLVQRGRRQHADRTGQHRGLIGQDVAEHVAGDHHVELLGRLDQLHRGIVDQHVAKLDIRVILAHLDHHIAPQLGAFEHVHLVHRAQLFVAFPGRLESDMADTADFRLAVHASY